MDFKTLTTNITDIRRNQNGSITMSFVTASGKKAFVKTVRTATIKAIYFAKREGRGLELTVKAGNLTFAKVV